MLVKIIRIRIFWSLNHIQPFFIHSILIFIIPSKGSPLSGAVQLVSVVTFFCQHSYIAASKIFSTHDFSLVKSYCVSV